MKKTKYPRLRTKVHRGKNGQVWTYYRFDMRGTGKSDIQLGTNYSMALDKWYQLNNGIALTAGTIQEAITRWRDDVLPTYDSAETRRGYTKQLANVEAAFGQMAWHEVNVHVLRTYLDRRTAKTQGNRELAVLSIVWSKAVLWGLTEKMWPATGIKGWKNPEYAREFEVTDALFNAVYEQADQVLKDAMDIATTTGMRLTDTRTVRMPVDGKLRFKANKRGKFAHFVVSESPVLTSLLRRRGNVDCVMLLTTPTGRIVSESMLRDRYELARTNAAIANPHLADEIKAMYLRDTRKRAADLAEDITEASKLLQHSSTKLTERHYRTKSTKLKAVR